MLHDSQVLTACQIFYRVQYFCIGFSGRGGGLDASSRQGGETGSYGGNLLPGQMGETGGCSDIGE